MSGGHFTFGDNAFMLKKDSLFSAVSLRWGAKQPGKQERNQEGLMNGRERYCPSLAFV